jgi:excisionase family DNA binding protein
LETLETLPVMIGGFFMSKKKTSRASTVEKIEASRAVARAVSLSSDDSTSSMSGGVPCEIVGQIDGVVTCNHISDSAIRETLSMSEIHAIADAVIDRLADRLIEIQTPEPLIDFRDAALFLGCSVPTVERLKKSGKLPYVEVGRLVRFRRSDILNQLKLKGI